MEINQVYKAPSLPKIGRRNINSSLNRGALGSGITAKKSTFSFNKVAPKLTSAKLNTDTDKSKESFNSIKPFKSNLDIVDVLKESNKLLYEIREQLSLDYNERIKEREENLRLAKKRITANKISEKEKKIESRGKSLIGSALNTVIAPAKSIFQRILDFLSIIITGIVLNTAFNWLSKKENQEKLEKFFNFLGDYWKELLVVFGAFKILRLVQKISKIGKGLKSLFNGFKGRGQQPPRTGGTTPPKVPGGGCGPVTGKGGCLDQLSSTSDTARNLAQTLFATAFATNYFKRFKSAEPSAPLEQTTEQEQEQQPPPLTTDKPSKKTEPIILKSFTGREIPQELSDVLDLLQREYKRTGKDQSALTEKGFLQVKATARNRLGLLGGPDLTPQISFNPKLTPKSNEEAIAAATALFTIANLPATLAPFAAGKGAVTRVIRSASKRSGLNNYRTPNVQNFGTAAKKSTGNNVIEFPLNRIRKNADKQTAAQIQTEYNAIIKRGYSSDDAIKILSEIKEFKNVLSAPSPVLRSEGGTIPGKGSPIVDSVPAMLAPGEEVIKTSSANLFRPLLKDINDNAGRLWRQFTEATIIQDKNNKKSEKMNLVFRKLLTEFTELFDKEKREIEKRKRKARRRQPVVPPGGGSPGLSSSRKSPPTSSGKIPNPKNTSSPMSTMRSSGKIPNPKNTSSPTSPSRLRNTNKVTPQISSTPQSVNKMSNKTPLQAVEIVPFPINNSEKQLESNISTPTPTINIQNIKNSPTTMSVGPLVIEKNSGAPSVNVVNLAPKVLDLSKKSTPKPSVTDSDAAPIPSISPFDSNNDFNYTVPETLGILV